MTLGHRKCVTLYLIHFERLLTGNDSMQPHDFRQERPREPLFHDSWCAYFHSVMQHLASNGNVIGSIPSQRPGEDDLRIRVQVSIFFIGTLVLAVQHYLTLSSVLQSGACSLEQRCLHLITVFLQALLCDYLFFPSCDENARA